MSLLRSSLLLLAAALPLAAQGTTRTAEPIREPVTAAKPEPTPDRPAFSLALEVVRSAPLRLSLQSAAQDQQPFLGVLLAATHEKTIQIEGLPPLLLADAIVATVIGKGDAQFELGPVKLPFTVWLQGVSIRDGVVEASPLLELPAAK